MNKKPIMINDVDVSGCEYWKGYCRISSLCDYAGHICEVTPNCYYKQLKRKEQECEQLRETIKLQNEMQKEVCEEKNKEIEQLKKINKANTKSYEKIYYSNEQLKAELKKYQDMAKEGLDNYKSVGGCWGCGISFSFDELLENYKKLENSYLQASKESPTATKINAKFNKYEKTLQEIKEMCSEMNCESLMQNSWCGDTDFKMGCCEKLFKKQILQKCEDLDI